MKIVFLFINGLHQLFHSAMTAMELGLIQDGVLCLSCNDEHTEELERIRQRCPGTATGIVQAKQPLRYRYLNLKGKLYPSVNAVLRMHSKLLSRADGVVTTSHGTPGLFRKHGITGPRIIFQYHGCGDRKYGFEAALGKMDLILLPGEYHRKRLAKEGAVDPERTRIVGWPKFDITSGQVDRPFANHRPTVLYCPHWDPALSSYRKFAGDIISHFEENTEYNLIFAPHMLVKHWRVHHGYRIHSKAKDHDNILIDYGSIKGTDGTYLRQADIYAGDVSSMVYEFIAMKPRPCIFLDAHEASWRNNPDYRFWEYGPVACNMDEFRSALSKTDSMEDYLELQRSRIPEYFNLTDTPSSKRAAMAIHEFMGGAVK